MSLGVTRIMCSIALWIREEGRERRDVLDTEAEKA
jgi:hypothetical protein